MCILLTEFESRNKELVRTQKTPCINTRTESLTVTLAWDVGKYKVHKLHQRYIL